MLAATGKQRFSDPSFEMLLLQTGDERQQQRKERDKAQQRQRAQLLRQARLQIPRHSRFGATFVQRDSTGSQIAQVAASGIHSRGSGPFVKAPAAMAGRHARLSSQVWPPCEHYAYVLRSTSAYVPRSTLVWRFPLLLIRLSFQISPPWWWCYSASDDHSRTIPESVGGYKVCSHATTPRGTLPAGVELACAVGSNAVPALPRHWPGTVRMQASRLAAHGSTVTKPLLQMLAGYAEDFLGAAYDTLMGNVRRVRLQNRLLSSCVHCRHPVLSVPFEATPVYG